MDLINACYRRDIDVINDALDSGVHIDKKYSKLSGGTLLHCACWTGALNVISILLNRGADMMALDDNGITPLGYVTPLNGSKIVHSFIDKGFNVNAKLDRSGSDVLGVACVLLDDQLVLALINEGSHVNIFSGPGIAPIMRVCYDSSHIGIRNDKRDEQILIIVKILLSHGADPLTRDHQGRTPFHQACRSGHIKLVKYFLEIGNHVNDMDRRGNVPIHYACRRGCYEIVELLLNHGANINPKDNDHMTPLHIACGNGVVEIVWLLLSNGADVNPINKKNRTPVGMTTRASTLGLFILYEIWNRGSELLGISQDMANEGSIFHYLGVCLYNIMELMIPEKPDI